MGAPNSGSLFQDITEPVVVINAAELLVKPSNLTYSIDKLPQFGSIYINDITGKFLYTPNTEYNGTDSFSVLTTSPALLGLPARSISQNYDITGQLVPINSSFNLDIDGDGKVTALGDGLMVIRKLFGAAFAGDALTNKAMSPTSTRTSAEIHQFIQQGITTGLLDVDKDGKTTALGDGLMVIRHLFGAAFAGAALTNKAISPDSPYFGPPANFAAVAANIDAMRPV
ncbi:Ig-like domain-containing protein [Synechococcus lacustris Tous-12m]